MKIKVNTKKLVAVIGAVAANTNKKSIVPIHDFVLLETEGNRFKATTRNEECQISQFFSMEEEAEFISCIHCNTLMNILRTLKIEEVELTMKERKNGTKYLFIKYGRGSAKIDCINPAEFDKMDTGEITNSITVIGDELFEKIKIASLCVDSKDLREAFTAVSVKATDKGAFLSGFSAACGTMQQVDVSRGTLPEVFIPKHICNLLDPAIMTGETEVSISDGKMVIRNGAFNLIGVLVKAKPLELGKIYDQKFPDHYVVDREMLLESCSRLVHFTGMDDNLIVLSFFENNLIIESDDELRGKSGEEVVPIASKDAEDLTVGVNASYMVTCLKSIDTKYVTINAKKPMSPMFISEEGGNRQDWCLGPMSVSAAKANRDEKNTQRLANIAAKGMA